MVEQILVSGDSYVDGVGDDKMFGGWTSRLSKHYKDKIQVYVHGIRGQNVVDLFKRFENEIQKIQNGLVFYQIGLNDSRIKTTLRNSHSVPLDFFYETYKEIVTKTKLNQNIKHIALFGLPLVDESLTNPYKQDKIYKNKYIAKYNTIIQKIAREESVAYISIADFINPEAKTLSDGLHPNTLGHEIILDLTLRYLQEIIHVSH